MHHSKIVDRKYENLTLIELAKAPVDAISGISESDAELLKKAFNVKTISDLAKLKYAKWAQAICTLADGEE
jgi:hypothetical protein